LGLLDKVKDLYGEQSPEEKKLADHVKQKIEEIRGSTRRVAAESIWLTNCAYSIGYPVFWNSQVKNFQPTDRAAPILQRNRIYVNKILPVLQNRLARLLKNPPKYDVRPESQDNEDKEAARLGLEIINWQWDRCNIDEKRISLGMWAQQCGHAYMKVSWDDALGKPMVNPETGELDYEGDVRVDVCSAFELFPDPLAKSFDDVLRSWIIQAKVRPLDYFRKQYPEKGHLVKQEDAWLQSVQFEGRLNSMSAKGSSSFGSEQMKNAAIELVKYEARSKDHPNGRMIVVANGILLDDKKLPCGEIPFAKFDDIIVGGKYDSEAVVTHLRPLQDTFNSIIRKRADWTSKLLAGKYVAARGTAIAQEAMNDRSGELLWYTPVPNAPNGGRPEPMQIPMIPQWAYTESEMIEKYFNDIAGISEVSQGHLPSSSIPAIGMALLQEQDETRIGIMTDQHERAWARIGGLILKYVEKYYTMERTIKLAGKNMEYTVKSFRGADIQENTDVIVIKGSSLPNSKAMKRQDILNAYQQGLLGDPMDPAVRQKVLDLTEFGDTQGIWEDQGLDMAQIRRGIQKLEAGEMPALGEFDNLPLWLQTLNRYRKQDKFEKQPPEIQGLFLGAMEACVHAQMELKNAMPDNIPGTDNGPPTPGQMANMAEADVDFEQETSAKDQLTNQLENMESESL